MPSDYTFLMFLLPFKLLSQISHTVAVSFGGFLGSAFERLDYLPTFCEFRLKPFGLVPGESVGEIAKDILSVCISLSFGFGGFLQGDL